MTPRSPRRRFWTKKRLAAALLLWLPLGYPASVGPVNYAVTRGWLPLAPAAAIYAPLSSAMRPFPAIQSAMNAYGVWWTKLAHRHETGGDPSFISGGARL
jgi:hypothetical protein